MRKTKLGNQKCSYDGMTFASKRERDRYCELKLLARAGKISDLRCQVEFLLIPEHREPDTAGPKGGRRRGKVIERACYYVADFVYTDEKGHVAVEDSKGYRNPSSASYAKFVLKRKLMLDRYGIRVREV